MATEAVRVMVRCRPMSIKEKEKGCKNVVVTDSSINQVSVHRSDAKDPPKTFSYDCVFGTQSLQSEVYEQTAFSLVDNVLQGYNGTIFAYGQTGCGKTHTMMGSTQSEESKGIIPRTFHQIITLTNSEQSKKHLVRCSFIEIYNEEIHDLLGRDIKAKMDLKESPDSGVFVKDLTMNIVKTEEEMQRFMDLGFKNRAVRQTAMNKESSRSHSIFTIHIESEETDETGAQKFKAGKLNLVDLAGSERQSKTQATGDGMKEAAKINLSLSALGNVISALVDGKTHHIPYRDSKLTRLLQDSLGGNTKTIMIAAISPADYNFDETISTLRYASRAKFIQNKPKINEDPKDTLLREYADEIKKLKMMLEGKAPIDPSVSSGSSEPRVVIKEVLVDREGNNIPSALGTNSEHLESELKSKNDQLKWEQEEKEVLKQQMEKLQSVISAVKAPVDSRELEKMRKLKERLKNQKKKQQELAAERRRREEELLEMEENYKSLNEEIEVMRDRFVKIKAKYLANQAELRDVRGENEREKEELLDTIRAQQVEVGKYAAIVNMLLTRDQVEQILQRSTYDDQNQEWSIVPFFYREKNLSFPKLSANHTQELINSEKEKKEVVFREISSYGRMSTDREIASFKDSNSIRDHDNNLRSDFSFKNGGSKRQGDCGFQNSSLSPNPKGTNAISKSKESYRISEVVRNARQSKHINNHGSGAPFGKTDYENRYEKKMMNGISSQQNLTSIHNIGAGSSQLKVPPKNPQLTPLKTESDHRLKLDEKNLNHLHSFGNGTSSSTTLGMSQGGSMGGIQNKVKLNPINSQKDVNYNQYL